MPGRCPRRYRLRLFPADFGRGTRLVRLRRVIDRSAVQYQFRRGHALRRTNHRAETIWVFGRLRVVKRLAECGGDIPYSDHNNANLLRWACASRSNNRKIIVDYLLDRAVDINDQNNMGIKALMVVNYPEPFDVELFASMLTRGADPTMEIIIGAHGRIAGQ